MKKKLVILGAGESGSGTAVLGIKKGYDVFVSDNGAIAEKYKAILNEYNILWEEKQHSHERILAADIVMKSPGISDTTPLVMEIRRRGIKVVSEIEFAFGFTNARLICVTGSNGKTTTTLLIHHILTKAGVNAGIGGNIGKSFALQVANEEKEVYVLEVSSFQLDDIEFFKPDIAVLTNITPDHLDRYDNDFEKYITSKFRIAANQTRQDVFIINSDDHVVLDWLKTNPVKSDVISFSQMPIAGDGAFIQNEEINIQLNDKRFNMKISNLGIQGKHNVNNSMAAAVSAMVMNIRNEAIREALADFKGVPHRLERVAAVRGIEFINDSKATNVNSSWYALESVHGDVVWIAGGTDKGNDYSELLHLVKDKVRAIIAIGVDNAKLKSEFSEMVNDFIEVASMQEAVKAAYFLAKNGDTVLLSPACASFDRFKNYEDRGDQFKECVRNL